MSPPSPRPRRRVTRHAATRPPTAEQLVSVLGDLGPHTLLALRYARGRTSLAARSLPPDPRCGAASLFCLNAPERSQVVGVAFVGRTVDAARTTGICAADLPGDVGDLRIDVALDRRGRVVSRLRAADRPPGEAVQGPVDGRVVDALHRVLGLPSPGEPPPIGELVLGLWMTLAVPLLSGGRAPSWAEVAALHPAVRPGAGSKASPTPAGAAGPPLSPGELARMGAELCGGESWAALHRSAAAGRFSAPELNAQEAAWMDTTLFARWVLESFPTVARVTAELRDRGAHGTADGIATVARLSIPAARAA